MYLVLLYLLNFSLTPDFSEKDYTVVFYKIDNLAEIIVNDSLVFSSGVVDSNPDIDGGIRFHLGKFLTEGKDEVVIQLFNGHPPYSEDERDQYWRIEYEILKGEKEFDFFWDFDDNYEIGIVFKETYYL